MADQLLIYDYTEVDPYWGFETPYYIGYGTLTAQSINAQIDGMAGDIDVHINSQGGKVFDGWAIYNKLKTYDRGTVNVFVDGIAGSIASIIAMAGQTVTMMQASMMMVHKPTGFYVGDMNADELASESQSLTEIESVLIDIYATKTGLSNTKLQSLIDACTWLSPDNAVALGFADKILKADNKPEISQDTYTNLFSKASKSTVSYVNSAFTIKHNEKNMSTVAELVETQNKTNSLLGDFINYFKGNKKNEGEGEAPVEEPVVEPAASVEPTVEELKAKIKELEDKQVADKEKVDNATTILNQATEMYNKVQTQLAEIKSTYQPAGENKEFNNRGDQQVEPKGRFSTVK